jgi:hypothetical protein
VAGMMTKQVSYQTVNEKIFLFVRNTGAHLDCIQLTKNFNSYNPPNFFKKNTQATCKIPNTW